MASFGLTVLSIVRTAGRKTFNTGPVVKRVVSADRTTVSRFQNPEYTGENRCLPCTVVNICLGAILSVVAGAAGGWVLTPVAGMIIGTSVFGVALAAIYFRGYLVPGTPTLTKRYFPESLLALFGKETEEHQRQESAADPEEILVAAGALEECKNGTDLCLTDGFRSFWYDNIEQVTETNGSRDHLLELLEEDSGSSRVDGNIKYQEYGDAFEAFLDNEVVGKWESEAAFRADLGGAMTLSTEYDRWDTLALQEKSQLITGLRLFIDRCPNCGGQPEFGTDTVESCCSTHQVAAVSCRDCDTRLFESRV